MRTWGTSCKGGCRIASAERDASGHPEGRRHVIPRRALSAVRLLTTLTLAALVMTSSAGAHTYTVQPGDSLASIGAANGVSAGAVARASGRAVEATLPTGAAVEMPA